MTQGLLDFTAPVVPTPESELQRQFDEWKATPGGRRVMADLYALAAQYSKVWKRTGIPVSMKLLFEIERHRIKTVSSRAQMLGVLIGKDMGYSLNNNRSAYVARHMVDRRPEWRGLFEFRFVEQEGVAG